MKPSERIKKIAEGGWREAYFSNGTRYEAAISALMQYLDEEYERCVCRPTGTPDIVEISRCCRKHSQGEE